MNSFLGLYFVFCVEQWMFCAEQCAGWCPRVHYHYVHPTSSARARIRGGRWIQRGRAVQILCRYWVDTEQILCRYCVDTVQILCRYCVDTGQILGKYWVNTGQILGRYWVDTGQILSRLLNVITMLTAFQMLAFSSQFSILRCLFEIGFSAQSGSRKW